MEHFEPDSALSHPYFDVKQEIEINKHEPYQEVEEKNGNEINDNHVASEDTNNRNFDANIEEFNHDEIDNNDNNDIHYCVSESSKSSDDEELHIDEDESADMPRALSPIQPADRYEEYEHEEEEEYEQQEEEKEYLEKKQVEPYVANIIDPQTHYTTNLHSLGQTKSPYTASRVSNNSNNNNNNSDNNCHENKHEDEEHIKLQSESHNFQQEREEEEHHVLLQQNNALENELELQTTPITRNNNNLIWDKSSLFYATPLESISHSNNSNTTNNNTNEHILPNYISSTRRDNCDTLCNNNNQNTTANYNLPFEPSLQVHDSKFIMRSLKTPLTNEVYANTPQGTNVLKMESNKNVCRESLSPSLESLTRVAAATAAETHHPYMITNNDTVPQSVVYNSNSSNLCNKEANLTHPLRQRQRAKSYSGVSFLVTGRNNSITQRQQQQQEWEEEEHLYNSTPRPPRCPSSERSVLYPQQKLFSQCTVTPLMSHRNSSNVNQTFNDNENAYKSNINEDHRDNSNSSNAKTHVGSNNNNNNNFVRHSEDDAILAEKTEANTLPTNTAMHITNNANVNDNNNNNNNYNNDYVDSSKCMNTNISSITSNNNSNSSSISKRTKEPISPSHISLNSPMMQMAAVWVDAPVLPQSLANEQTAAAATTSSSLTSLQTSALQEPNLDVSWSGYRQSKRRTTPRSRSTSQPPSPMINTLSTLTKSPSSTLLPNNITNNNNNNNNNNNSNNLVENKNDNNVSDKVQDTLTLTPQVQDEFMSVVKEHQSAIMEELRQMNMSLQDLRREYFDENKFPLCNQRIRESSNNNNNNSNSNSNSNSNKAKVNENASCEETITTNNNNNNIFSSSSNMDDKLLNESNVNINECDIRNRENNNTNISKNNEALFEPPSCLNTLTNLSQSQNWTNENTKKHKIVSSSSSSSLASHEFTEVLPLNKTNDNNDNQMKVEKENEIDVERQLISDRNVNITSHDNASDNTATNVVASEITLDRLMQALQRARQRALEKCEYEQQTVNI